MVDAPVGRPLPRRPNLVTLTVGPAASQCDVTPTATADAGETTRAMRTPRAVAPSVSETHRGSQLENRLRQHDRADGGQRAAGGNCRREPGAPLVTPSKLQRDVAQRPPTATRAEIGECDGRCLGWCGPLPSSSARVRIVNHLGEDVTPLLRVTLGSSPNNRNTVTYQPKPQ